MQRIQSMLFKMIPTYNKTLYRICNRYVDRYSNNADSRMERNGEITFLKHISKTAQTVFDVGANTGEWAQLVLSYNSGVEIHCFEPSRITFQMLLQNEFPDNVTCNNIGLSSEKKIANLQVIANGSGRNSLYTREPLAKNKTRSFEVKQEEIKLDTLDGYCQENHIDNIDLLKIDVEGHEYQVLQGAKQLLQHGAIHSIQFEYGPDYIYGRVFLKDMFEYLQSFGYRLYKLYPTELHEKPEYDYTLENFKYQNWVASLLSLSKLNPRI